MLYEGDTEKTQHATTGLWATVHRESTPDRGTWDWEQRGPLYVSWLPTRLPFSYLLNSGQVALVTETDEVSPILVRLQQIYSYKELWLGTHGFPSLISALK